MDVMVAYVFFMGSQGGKDSRKISGRGGEEVILFYPLMVKR